MKHDEQAEGHGGPGHSFDSSPSGAKARFVAMGLSEDDVAVLAMVLYDGLSYAQVGVVMGVTKQSVRDRIAKCQRILAKHFVPFPDPMPKRVAKPDVIYLAPAMLDSEGGFGGRVADCTGRKSHRGRRRESDEG